MPPLLDALLADAVIGPTPVVVIPVDELPMPVVAPIEVAFTVGPAPIEVTVFVVAPVDEVPVVVPPFELVESEASVPQAPRTRPATQDNQRGRETNDMPASLAP